LVLASFPFLKTFSDFFDSPIRDKVVLGKRGLSVDSAEPLSPQQLLPPNAIFFLYLWFF